MKLKGLRTKHILKRALSDRVPKEILERRKTGFPVPFQKWFSGELKDFVHDLLTDRRHSPSWLLRRPRHGRLCWRRSQSGADLSAEIFSLVTLELWHREFVDGELRSKHGVGKFEICSIERSSLMMRSGAETARRVLLLGATFATDNMGVGALASGAISILARQYPDAQISFLDYGREPTRSPVEVDGRSFEVPLVNLRFSWKVFLKNNIVYLLVLAGLSRVLGEGFAQRMAQSNPWIKAIREADVAVAVSGGDSFSDIYGLGRYFYVYLPQLLVLSVRYEARAVATNHWAFPHTACALPC